jgi:hypothetical protein
MNRCLVVFLNGACLGFSKGFGSMLFPWTLDFVTGFSKNYWYCKYERQNERNKKTMGFILDSSH